MMTIKIGSEVRGDHIHMTVRAGETEGSLGLCGALVMRVGEWQLFGAALKLGAERMCGHLKVDIPGQDSVVKALVEQSHAADADQSLRLASEEILAAVYVGEGRFIAPAALETPIRNLAAAMKKGARP